MKKSEYRKHLKHAWELLDDLCPELRDLAALVNEKILQPLLKGHDVRVLNEAEDLPVQEILEAL